MATRRAVRTAHVSRSRPSSRRAPRDDCRNCHGGPWSSRGGWTFSAPTGTRQGPTPPRGRCSRISRCARVPTAAPHVQSAWQRFAAGSLASGVMPVGEWSAALPSWHWSSWCSGAPRGGALARPVPSDVHGKAHSETVTLARWSSRDASTAILHRRGTSPKFPRHTRPSRHGSGSSTSTFVSSCVPPTPALKERHLGAAINERLGRRALQGHRGLVDRGTNAGECLFFERGIGGRMMRRRLKSSCLSRDANGRAEVTSGNFGDVPLLKDGRGCGPWLGARSRSHCVPCRGRHWAQGRAECSDREHPHEHQDDECQLGEAAGPLADRHGA